MVVDHLPQSNDCCRFGQKLPCKPNGSLVKLRHACTTYNIFPQVELLKMYAEYSLKILRRYLFPLWVGVRKYRPMRQVVIDVSNPDEIQMARKSSFIRKYHQTSKRWISYNFISYPIQKTNPMGKFLDRRVCCI